MWPGRQYHSLVFMLPPQHDDDAYSSPRPIGHVHCIIHDRIRSTHGTHTYNIHIRNQASVVASTNFNIQEKCALSIKSYRARLEIRYVYAHHHHHRVCVCMYYSRCCHVIKMMCLVPVEPAQLHRRGPF